MDYFADNAELNIYNYDFVDATQVLDEIYYFTFAMMKLSAIDKKRFYKLINVFELSVS